MYRANIRTSGVAALLSAAALLATMPARAENLADLVQPGVALQWRFGGEGRRDLELDLRFDLSDRVRGQLGSAVDLGALPTLPALAQWRIRADGEHALYSHGLQVGASRLWLDRTDAAASGQQSRQSFWGANVGTILLAAGAAAALVIAVAGDAADDITEDSSPGAGAGSGGGEGAGSDECDVSGAPPLTGDCIVSGGTGI